MASPVVCTLATGEVERIAQLNGGLHWNELLSAFSNCHIKTHFRSISSHYPLNELRVRFIRASELRPRPINVAEELMRAALVPWPSEASLMTLAVQSDEEAQSMPWYQRYRQLLRASLACGEESMADCPALLLVAVASSDVDPVSCFEQLDSAHFMPVNFQSGQYDPTVGRVYVLVHDMSAAPTGKVVDPEAILRQMKQRFRGTPCQLLLLNSLPLPNLAAPDVWEACLAPVFFPDQIPRHSAAAPARGCLLSADDMLALRDLVAQVAVKEVVPALEKRMATLNACVTSSRKGVKNVIKSWWRKPKEAEDRGGLKGVQYRHDQIESQILLLADCAMSVRDVETALAMYRLVRDDYKSDKALLHQGCCQAMVAVCHAALEGDGHRRRDMELSLRDAIASFQTAQAAAGGRREVTLATRLATQASLVLADLLAQQPGRHRDAAEVLVRASRDESFLSSAVLLEQAAWLFQAHAFGRKFAFHVILAGIKYQTAGLEQHAVRCFTAAQPVYAGTGWVHIQDYVQAHLAKHTAALGAAAAALSCYLRIVSAGRQSAERQARFVKEFVDLCLAHPDALDQLICAQSGEAELLSGLGIPRVLDAQLEVFEAQNAATSDVAPYNAAKVPLSEARAWAVLVGALECEVGLQAKGLEEAAKASVESFDAFQRKDAKGWSAVHSVRSLKAAALNNPRARGEVITVGLVLANPLDVAVVLTDVQLVAAMAASDAEPGTTLDVPTFDAHTAKLLASAESAPLKEFGELVVDSLSVTLEPRQTIRVCLRVCPLQTGRLVVSGLKWRLHGQVWAAHDLNLPGALLHDSLDHRATAARAPNATLTFDVVGDLPWLSLDLKGLPDTLLQGELVPATLTVRNVGRAAAHGVVLKSNAPWCYVGPAPAFDPSHPAATPAPALAGASGTALEVVETLGVGEEVTLPLWLRGVGGGKQALQLVLQYSDPQKRAAVRYVRHACEVCVLPSLHTEATVTPLQNGEYLLSVGLTNFRSDGLPLAVHEVCALSKLWSVEPMAEPPATATYGEKGTLLLRPQESALLSFRLKPAPSGESDVQAAHWSPGSSPSQSAAPMSEPLKTAVAYMCTDDMVAAFQRQCAVLRKERFAAQSGDTAPRGISSIRRDRAAAAGGAASSAGLLEGASIHPGSAAALCGRYPSELSVLVTWGRGPAKVTGHHQMLALGVGPAAVGPVAVSCPLALTVDAATVVRHDFRAEPSCAFPVTLRVTNLQTRGGACLDFTVEVAKEASEQLGDSSLTWLGAGTHTVKQLAPSQSAALYLSACCDAPGVFQLNRCLVRLADGRVFAFPTQALVAVLPCQ